LVLAKSKATQWVKYCEYLTFALLFSVCSKLSLCRYPIICFCAHCTPTCNVILHYVRLCREDVVFVRDQGVNACIAPCLRSFACKYTCIDGHACRCVHSYLANYAHIESKLFTDDRCCQQITHWK